MIYNIGPMQCLTETEVWAVTVWSTRPSSSRWHNMTADPVLLMTSLHQPPVAAAAAADDDNVAEYVLQLAADCRPNIPRHLQHRTYDIQSVQKVPPIAVVLSPSHTGPSVSAIHPPPPTQLALWVPDAALDVRRWTPVWAPGPPPQSLHTVRACGLDVDHPQNTRNSCHWWLDVWHLRDNRAGLHELGWTVQWSLVHHFAMLTALRCCVPDDPAPTPPYCAETSSLGGAPPAYRPTDRQHLKCKKKLTNQL